MGTGETKGERVLAGSSHLLPCGCACIVIAPTTPQPLQDHTRGQVALSNSSILLFSPQKQQIALNFLFILGRRDLVYSLKVQGGVLELSWWHWL